MASRNGLNPKIRGLKGVGFNRALPAPFSFDLSFKGNGSNYFALPTLVGTQIPDAFTAEFWLKPTNPTPSSYLSIFGFKSSTNITTSIITLSNKIALSPDGIRNLFCDTINYGSWNHFIFSCDFVNGIIRCVTNGNISSVATSMPVTSPALITAIGLCGTVGGSPYDESIDEFRVYNKVITDLEIVNNYNAGAGNNPTITENLLLWYKFEQFETLDFSHLQDNSDLKLGIRDLSGRGNHIQSMGAMDTNPSSPSYSLQPY